jgi:glucose-1-phosphate cytidylyltransferase
MKVVLFCGGLGLRIRDYSKETPKPMVKIGYRPILWHLMKYYAHYGHRDFVLCLGYQADMIKDYFLNYSEYYSNDFVLTGGGRKRELLSRDIDDWSITFVDTGFSSNIGQRLKAVQEFVDGEEVFLANYSDNLTDFHLPTLIDRFVESDAAASFLSVNPHQSFHIVRVSEDQRVREIAEIANSGLLVNGGFFVFRHEIFDYISDGEDLVYAPFQRLIELGKLMTLKCDGFWACMDTFKDKQMLDELYASGSAPWEVWREQNGACQRMPACVSSRQGNGQRQLIVPQR